MTNINTYTKTITHTISSLSMINALPGDLEKLFAGTEYEFVYTPQHYNRRSIIRGIVREIGRALDSDSNFEVSDDSILVIVDGVFQGAFRPDTFEALYK
jgi:hypothetical protein